MKRLFPFLSLMLLALFHQGCGNNAAAPAAPGAAAVNHNYPLFFTFGGSGSGNGQFTNANGIVVYQGAIFVSEDTATGRVQKFDLNGNFIASTLGNPGLHFSHPYGMAFDSSGLLYVADFGNNLIQVLDRNLNYISSFGSFGTALGQFNSPAALAFDSTNRIYVAEYNNYRLQRCSNTGASCVTVGGTTSGTGNGQFDHPAGVSVDKSGNVWVTDYINVRIQEFNSSLAFIQKWGSPGTGNGLFSGPWDVRVDQDGNVIVADYAAGTSGSVQKYTPSGAFIQQIGTGWAGAEYTAFDASNNLYVTDYMNNTVSIFKPN